MKNDKYIPVNKGHFDLDSEERAKEFSRKLAFGWEKEYEEYRRLWHDAPQNRLILDYPVLVDLELSSLCNLACPMCPTITDKFRIHTKKKIMDTELAKKIIDEVAGKVYALRLSWVGEPTLHKDLVEIIAYAKDKGIKEISFLTNGSKLKLDYFILLQKAGIDWITVSVDGMGENYNKIRNPLIFDDTFAKLKEISLYKKQMHLDKPVIKIQAVWPAIRQDPEGFYKTFLPFVDLIAYNPLIDYLHKDTDIIYQSDFCCPQHYQRITVSATGEVAMCSNDDEVRTVIGDANNESIHSIWHGKPLNKIREMHNMLDGFKEIDVCRLCYYPRKVMPNETATVNGRIINIENYINRAQEVGK
jgi:radical SAM protein with 4Fe4S-binding SPASM domain